MADREETMSQTNDLRMPAPDSCVVRALLEHVVDNAGAEIIVAHAGLAGRLAEVDTANLKKVVIFGGEPTVIGDLDVYPASVLDSLSSEIPSLARPIEPWDIQS